MRTSATATAPYTAYAEVLSFYVWVERLDDPALRGQPVIVGGDPKKRGRIQSVSAEAQACGVEVGMAVAEGKALCPAAKLILTNMKRYRELSSLLHSTMRSGSEGIESDGLSGAFLTLSSESLDETNSRESLTAAARCLTAKVREETGLPLWVGVAPIKFLARLVARDSGEAGVRVVEAGEVEGYLSSLSAGRLPGVGAKTLEVFADLRISTVGELLSLDSETVEARLGRHGRRILAFARGEDDSQLRTARHPKSLSHEFTFDEPVCEMAGVEACLARLCKTAEAGLRQEDLCGKRIAVKVKFAEGKAETRTRTLVRPVNRAGEIHAAAMRLLGRTEAGSRPLQLLGISLAGLGPLPEPDSQLNLFSLDES